MNQLPPQEDNHLKSPNLGEIRNNLELPQQTVKRIEEALDLFLNEDAAKLLLHDTQITREHNGICYKMVNKEVALKAMRYLVASEAQRNREMGKELNDLNEWKEAALIVFNNIDLQQCGKLLNLPLGTDIAKQILPSIQSLQKENNLLEEREVLWQNRVAALEERSKELVEALQNLLEEYKITCDDYAKQNGSNWDKVCEETGGEPPTYAAAKQALKNYKE